MFGCYVYKANVVFTCSMARFIKPMLHSHVRLPGLNNQCYTHMFGSCIYNTNVTFMSSVARPAKHMSPLLEVRDQRVLQRIVYIGPQISESFNESITEGPRTTSPQKNPSHKVPDQRVLKRILHRVLSPNEALTLSPNEAFKRTRIPAVWCIFQGCNYYWAI